jgi:DNA polymerase I-like protein with 3'-5' exonuclease and polymerase domains
MRSDKPIYLDTESIGFYGPTILIQWALGNGDVSLHDIWSVPVGDTLNLIENICTNKGGVIGFNMTHDWYHLTRTYGTLSLMPRKNKPTFLDYQDCQEDMASHDTHCLKPMTALDLMIYGRKNEFQSTLNQKAIYIRKIPAVLAEQVVAELQERVKIPDIYFSKSRIGYRWRIIRLLRDGREVTPEMSAKQKRGEQLDINPDFVHLKLAFSPSTALKVIIERVLKKEVVFLSDLPELPKPDEHGYFPHSRDWLDVANMHLHAWTIDTQRREYAKNDVVYLRELDNYFGYPALGDVDSVLSCAIGAMYWRGFTFDRAKVINRLQHCRNVVSRVPININAPAQVRKWITDSCSALERQAVPSTKKEILLAVSEWVNHPAAEKAKQVLAARQAEREIDLFKKLLHAGRLHVMYKVLGTKSDRMAGGSEAYLKRGGSINPQGIKKGDEIRTAFTLGFLDMPLSGGDFSGFEVSIADAVYGDEELRRALLSGKKIHGLFGAEIYKMTYEAVMVTENLNENDPNGYYQRAKRGFFALLYGAAKLKLSQALWISEEEAEAGLLRFVERFPGIKRAQQRIYDLFCAMRQPGGIGTEVVWNEPQEYVESFLGFRRYFTLEISVMKALFDMATGSSEILQKLGKGIKVVRRERVQTACGAVSSALYGAAFGIQGKIMRAAANMEIQSPGGTITKDVQFHIWELQPCGISRWYVMPMNSHDEIESPTHESLTQKVKETVDSRVEFYRKKVPLIKMKWKTHLTNWGEK